MQMWCPCPRSWSRPDPSRTRNACLLHTALPPAWQLGVRIGLGPMTQPRRPVQPAARWLPLALVSVGACIGLVAFVPNVGAAPSARSYAVATESAGATREAGRVLSAGGNAFDAAVCAALVAGFTDPSSSGIGGGGFALVWSARDQKPFVLDFRETAPAAIDVAVLEQRPVP